jgi:hypothetical protein
MKINLAIVTATTFEGYKELSSEDRQNAGGMNEIQRKIADEVYDNVCRAQEKQKLNFDQLRIKRIFSVVY